MKKMVFKIGIKANSTDSCRPIKYIYETISIAFSNLSKRNPNNKSSNTQKRFMKTNIKGS